MKLNGRPRWTVVSAAAAAIAIGAAGTALANDAGGDRSTPNAIRLQESVPVASTTAAPSNAPAFTVIPSRVIDADDSVASTQGRAQADDTLDGTFDSPGDSPNTVSASPDDSPAGIDDTATVDDVDTATVDDVATASIDDVDTFDSPAAPAATALAVVDDTVNSVETYDSPAVASVDTIDSADSPDATS